MFKWYMKALIRRGSMVLVEGDGRTTQLGEPKWSPIPTLRIKDRATMRRLSFSPELAFGEAYMDGTMTVENGTIRYVIGLIFDNRADEPKIPQSRLAKPFRPVFRRPQQYNPVTLAQRRHSPKCIVIHQYIHENTYISTVYLIKMENII